LKLKSLFTKCYWLGHYLIYGDLSKQPLFGECKRCGEICMVPWPWSYKTWRHTPSFLGRIKIRLILLIYYPKQLWNRFWWYWDVTIPYRKKQANDKSNS
jgi:hypothetical protein